MTFTSFKSGLQVDDEPLYRSSMSPDGTMSANSDDLASTQKAIVTYVSASVSGAIAGVLNDRGQYNPNTTNLWPVTGGRGVGGLPIKGDVWEASASGTMNGTNIEIGWWFRALIDTPGQSAANWAISISQITSTDVTNALGYIPYNATNPSGYITSAALAPYMLTASFTDAAVTGKLITGYVSSPGVVSAADSLLQAIQKLNGNIGALTTGVSSVFGRTSAVTAQNGDYNTSLVTENTNLYFTNARVDSRVQSYTGDVTLSSTIFSIGANKVTNGMLVNSSITIQGSAISLGGSINIISGTGFVKSSGTTISYDNSTYLTTSSATTLYLPINNPAYTGILSTGTLSYSTTGLLASFVNTTAGFNQLITQNLSNGSTSSTGFITSNDSSTNTNLYGEFGQNSSGFIGTGIFNQPSYIYLTSTGTDLAIGTTTANNIHFVINGGTADTALISSTGLTVTGTIVKSGGTSSQFLKADGSIDSSIYLTTVNLATNVGATILPVANGGTNIASYSIGDLLQATGTTTLTKLASVAAGSFLRSGGVTTASSWSTLTIPNTMASLSIPYCTSANTIGTNASFTYDGSNFNLAGPTAAIRIGGAGVLATAAATGTTIYPTAQNSINLNDQTNGNPTVFKFMCNTAGQYGLSIGNAPASPTAKLQFSTNTTSAPVATGNIISVLAATFNDGSAGTTTALYLNNYFGQQTLTATNAQTYTDVANLYIKGAPIISSNVTATRNMALWVAAGLVRFDGTLAVGQNSATYTVDVAGDIGISTDNKTLRLKTTRLNQATLVAGTIAISLTGVTTASRAFVQLVVESGTLGASYKAVCTSGTLTITSVNTIGSTNVSDTSTVNYIIFENY